MNLSRRELVRNKKTNKRKLQKGISSSLVHELDWENRTFQTSNWNEKEMLEKVVV